MPPPTPSFHLVGLLVFWMLSADSGSHSEIWEHILNIYPTTQIRSLWHLQTATQCCFLAVCSCQTTLNPIVFCFNCATSGCWLVTQHARLAHLGEVQLYDLTTRAGLHTQIHARISTKSVYWCLEEQLRSPVEPITHTALISLERGRGARLKDGGDWRWQ